MSLLRQCCHWHSQQLVLWQVEVQSVEAGRHEGNLLYLLHVYCDSLSRLLEKHAFQSFGKYEHLTCPPTLTPELSPDPWPSFQPPLHSLASFLPPPLQRKLLLLSFCEASPHLHTLTA